MSRAFSAEYRERAFSVNQLPSFFVPEERKTGPTWVLSLQRDEKDAHWRPSRLSRFHL